jgi:hypothetical protein
MVAKNPMILKICENPLGYSGRTTSPWNVVLMTENMYTRAMLSCGISSPCEDGNLEVIFVDFLWSAVRVASRGTKGGQRVRMGMQVGGNTRKEQQKWKQKHNEWDSYKRGVRSPIAQGQMLKSTRTTITGRGQVTLSGGVGLY